jgi:hydroxymethylglutaryl-CoA reductase
MRDVTIRCRADGITELSPKIAPLRAADRAIVIGAVVSVTLGLFLGGLLPPVVAALVAGACFAGEIVLLVKAAALALLRPLAEVREMPSFTRRRAGRP